MLKKALTSLTISALLSIFLALYFFIQALNNKDYQLEKSNGRSAVIVKLLVNNAKLKKSDIINSLENNKTAAGYDFNKTIDELRKNEQFLINSLPNTSLYLDEYIPDSGNQFIRTTFYQALPNKSTTSETAGLSMQSRNHNAEKIHSKICWQQDKCRDHMIMNSFYLDNSSFVPNYDSSGRLSFELPIYSKDNNVFIAKLTLIIDISNDLIFRNSHISIERQSSLSNIISVLKLTDKRAFFGEDFSYSRTYLIDDNFAIEIFTPYTSLIREKLDGIELLFVALFILFMGMLNYFEQRKNHAQLQSITYNDQLTGLYNRQYFDSPEFLGENKKHLDNDGSISVIVIDGDGIKAINDTYGHAVGDTAIQHIANTILRCTRENDVTFRAGGDEFVVVLRADIKAAKSLTQRIKSAMESNKMEFMDINLSVSAGYTELQLNESLDSALNRADKLLYADKANNQQKDSSESVNS